MGRPGGAIVGYFTTGPGATAGLNFNTLNLLTVGGTTIPTVPFGSIVGVNPVSTTAVYSDGGSYTLTGMFDYFATVGGFGSGGWVSTIAYKNAGGSVVFTISDGLVFPPGGPVPPGPYLAQIGYAINLLRAGGGDAATQANLAAILSGDDTLTGTGFGDLLQGFGGADILDGGLGIDTASYSASPEAVTVSLDAGTGSGGHAQGDTLVGIENLIGSGFDDVLVGDSLANVLDGGAGSDTVSYVASGAGVTVNLAGPTARGGHAEGDTLISIENVTGSAYADVLIGANGNSVAEGLAGADQIYGATASYAHSGKAVTLVLNYSGSGNGSGGDAQGDLLGTVPNLVGSAFGDTLVFQSGPGDPLTFANRIEGLAGADVLGGGGGKDILLGGDGNDLLEGGQGADQLDGGAGVDTASYAGSSLRVLVDLAAGKASGGDAQGDTLTAIENLTGSAYDDIFSPDDGVNVLDGGAGIDTVSYAASTAAVTVDLLAGTGSGGAAAGDWLIRIENVFGSALDDGLFGNNVANRLAGLAGADNIHGGNGNDILSGGDGNDQLYGDSGNDVIRGEAGNDVLSGGNGKDVLDGGAGNDAMSGGGGADRYYVDSVGDTVTENAGGGSDRVVATVDFTLSANIEILVLDGSAVYGMGNNQDNVIYGTAGVNELVGAGGADRLIGGDGADTLDGDAGNDQLYGGLGDDVFRFTSLAGGGIDRIADWAAGDKIQVDGTGFGFHDLQMPVVNGTTTRGLPTDGAYFFYNTVGGRLYFHDGDTGALTQFAVVVTKPASLDSGDFLLFAS